jgi:hypothetical protein
MGLTQMLSWTALLLSPAPVCIRVVFVSEVSARWGVSVRAGSVVGRRLGEEGHRSLQFQVIGCMPESPLTGGTGQALEPAPLGLHGIIDEAG